MEDDLEDIKERGICEDCGQYRPLIRAVIISENGRLHQFCKGCYANWLEMIEAVMRQNVRRGVAKW